jgi:hypothetical protein
VVSGASLAIFLMRRENRPDFEIVLIAIKRVTLKNCNVGEQQIAQRPQPRFAHRAPDPIWPPHVLPGPIRPDLGRHALASARPLIRERRLPGSLRECFRVLKKTHDEPHDRRTHSRLSSLLVTAANDLSIAHGFFMRPLLSGFSKACRPGRSARGRSP